MQNIGFKSPDAWLVLSYAQEYALAALTLTTKGRPAPTV